jgi:hypothetical protein
MSKIEIPLSKTKTLLTICGALLFVIAGFYLFTIAGQQTRYYPIVVKIVSLVAILFFGAAGAVCIKKLFDKNIGLMIDENGIFDNTNASSIGLIEWNDITDIRTEKVQSTKFFLIYIKNPEKYLNKANVVKRKLMKGNNKMYGTPLSITSNSLKCKFSYLEKIINNSFTEQQIEKLNRE